MEMHQVRYFLAVVSTSNFTRAAERCNVSPPSLIKAIKLLEADFGGELFHRKRSGSVLTELGRIVLPFLEQIVSSAETAKTESAKKVQLQSMSLKLGVMCTLAPRRFLGVIAKFQKRWPHVHLVIVDDNALMLQKTLLDDDLDVAIYAMPGTKNENKLHHLPLYEEEMVIGLPSGHALAVSKTISACDLDGLPYIERINCEFGEHGEALFSQKGITGPTVCRSERDDWVLGMVANGFGYAFLSAECAQHPGVAARPIDNMPIFRRIDLVTVRGRKHSPAVGAFVRQIGRWNWNGAEVNEDAAADI